MNGVDVLDIRDGLVVRILTAFDPLPVAEQLLGLTLRPTPGSWRGTLAVGIQRTLAVLARIRAAGAAERADATDKAR